MPWGYTRAKTKKGPVVRATNSTKSKPRTTRTATKAAPKRAPVRTRSVARSGSTTRQPVRSTRRVATRAPKQGTFGRAYRGATSERTARRMPQKQLYNDEEIDRLTRTAVRLGELRRRVLEKRTLGLVEKKRASKP